MIVLMARMEGNQYVNGTCILTPPKCGSTSLHEGLCGRYVNGHLAHRYDGLQPDHTSDKHTMVLPYDFKNYQLVLIYRNPADRLNSLYKHYCKYERAIAPEIFLKQQPTLHWFYSWTIRRFVETYLLHANIRYVKLSEASEFFNVPIPHENRNQSDESITVPDWWLTHDLPRSLQGG